MLSDTFRENKASLGCQSGDGIGTKSPQSSLKWKFRAGPSFQGVEDVF